MVAEHPIPSSAPVQIDRRASITSSSNQRVAGFFGKSPTATTALTGTASLSGSLTQAVEHANAQHRRRASVTALALGQSPSSPSSSSSAAGFPIPRKRDNLLGVNTSLGSSPSDECAIDDKDVARTPSSPFARRMSFGARALHGSTASNNDGFTWSEQFKQRAERASSISQRSGSIAAGVPETKAALPSVPDRIPSVPAGPARSPKQPDHLQERILKGDFYMD